MSWNYRVMKTEIRPGEYEFGIYEVYYSDEGKVTGWTENSLIPVCPSENDLLYELNKMKEAFDKETLTAQ